MKRRTYLLTTAGAALTLAGCSESSDGEPEETGSTTDSDDQTDSGDQPPAPVPNSSFDIDHQSASVTFTKAAGDDFEIDNAEIQYDISVSGRTDIADEGTITDIGTDQAGSPEDALFSNDGSEPYVEFIAHDSAELVAGDTFEFVAVDSTADANPTIESWEVEILWNPDGSDSQVIFSSNSS